jgi:PAS domain S-box-containing protein
MENSREKHRQPDSSKDHSENSLHKVHEGKLCEVFERMSDGFYAVGRDWCFTYVNRRAEELWNRSQEELLGKNIWQEFPRAVGSGYYQQVNRAMEEGVTTEFETASLVLDAWVAGGAYPSPDGLSVYFQDITERRHAEEALQESNRRMENILESITEDFFAVDRKWRYTYINEQALRRIRARKGEGVSREELMGKSVWEVFPEAVGSVFYQKYHEAVREQQTVHFEGYLPLTEEWYECFAYPLEEGLAVYYRDITERQRAVKRLQEAEEKYRSLFENAVEGIFQTTVGGRLLTANPALARIAGYESPEKLIANVSDLGSQIHANPEGRAEFVRRVRQHGALTDYEHQIRRKNGTLTWLSSSARAMRDTDGNLIGFEGRVVDINERKRAEEELRLSEERFRAHYKSLPVPTFSWRRVRDDFELTDYNEAADQITRGGLKRLLGMRASEWYSDNPQILEMLWRCFSEGITIREETPWQMRTTGEHKHFAVTFAPVPPDLVMHHAEDVTERKQAEEALEESHNLLRSIIEGTPDAIFLKDFKGRYLMANSSAAKILGQSAQEVLGKDNAALMPPEVARRITEVDRHVMDTEESQTGEEQLAVEGVTRTYLFTKAPYRDHRGEVAGVIGITRDITERKETEEALRLRAELLDLSYEPIFAWELEGDIVYWNRGAEDLYGFSKQEAVGRESHRLLQTIHPIPLEEFKHVLERDGQWIGELEHTAHDGRKVIVESRHMLVPTARDRRLVLETNYDITERKRLEENQQRFLTNAAHQLKTPITTIVGAAELLVTKENLDVAKRRQLLDHIFSEGNHLQRLSGTLLRLARVGWDQREPSLEMVDLAAAARQAAERITPLAEAAGLSLHVEGNGACVLADPEWLQEVLLVLLSNAMKHSKSGQNISLWARESTITVEDEGAGISPMDLPHVFERFYRGKGSSEGFGLGLSICRELVERMGGYINLSSGEEVGTTVKIELPEAGVGA